MIRGLRRARDDAIQAALSGAFALAWGRHYRALIGGARTPRETQQQALHRIVSENADTEFGRRHDFSGVRTIEDFRRAVPVHSYEDLRPSIERQELTGARCLTAARPIYFSRTSGTLGTPKNIPVTSAGLRRIVRYQQIATLAQIRGSDVFRGKAFAITGPALEGRMAGGTPFGSASGLLYEQNSRIVRARYVLPAAVSSIKDYDSRYLVMAVLGAAERHVSSIATANPSTLVRLLSVVNEKADLIFETIASGRLDRAASGTASRLGSMRADPARARELAALYGRSGRLGYGDIWPDLAGVATWTGGSCAVPLAALCDSLPERAQIIELGYLASELRGTINIDVRRGLCVPTLLDNVFEFVEREAWEDGRGDVQALHELDVGCDYYVFVTTPDGLYRYDMNDIVRVTGRVGETPALQFVQKGKGVTSITGEKLSEAQAIEAVQSVLTAHRIGCAFFVLLADARESGYTLYFEDVAETGTPCDGAVAEAFDNRLRAVNVEYDSKRASGRLAAVKARRVRPGTGDSYRRSRIAGGQRDAQFKVLHLQRAEECDFDFAAYAVTGG